MLSLMAQPDCPLCSGTGWRLVERVDANQKAERVVERKDAVWAPPPRRLSSLGRCRATAPEATARLVPWTGRAFPGGTNTAISKTSTPTFGMAGPMPRAWNRSLSQARIVIEAFARNYPAGGETGILLMGSCGTGKTHLAVSALRQLMLRGHGARFYDYRELLKEIQASYDPDHPVSEMGVLEPVLETEVLLIDDIGASKPSDWALDTIGHILNKRYNEKRVTLLTTNYLDGSGSYRRAGAACLPARR